METNRRLNNNRSTYSNNSKSTNSLVFQGSILVVAALISRIIGFTYKIPLSNMFTDEGNGYYGYAATIYAFFLVISTQSFPASISKITAEKYALNQHREAKKIFSSSLVLALLLGGIVATILWFGARPLALMGGNEKNVHAIKALVPAIIIFSMLSVLRGYFQGMNNMLPTAISQVVEQVFNVIFSLYLAFLMLPMGQEFGAAGGTLGTGIGALAALFVMIIIYMRYNRQKISKKNTVLADKNYENKSIFYYWKQLSKVAVPIVIGLGIASFVPIVNVMMFQRCLMFNGYSEDAATAVTGIYTMRHQPLIALPISFMSAFAGASIPSLAASLAKKRKEEVNKKIVHIIKITVLICLPACVGLFVLAEPINRMLFPTADSVLIGNLLKLGSLSIIAFGISSSSIGILQGLGKLRVPIRTTIVGLFVKIFGNLFFVLLLNWNVYGIVLSNVLFALVIATLNFIPVYKFLTKKPNWNKLLVQPVLVSGVMGMVTFLSYVVLINMSNRNSISTLIAISFGILTYCILSIKWQVVSEQEILGFPKGKKIIGLLKKLHLL